MLFRPPPVRRPVYVILLAEKLLDRIHLGFRHARQLARLDDPVTLQELRGILPLKSTEGIRVPVHPQPPEKSALAYALLSRQDQHRIKFYARPERSRHSPYQRLPDDLSRVDGILCTKIIYEQRIHPPGTVPFQPRQVVPQFIHPVVQRIHREPVQYLLLPRDLVDSLHIAP